MRVADFVLDAVLRGKCVEKTVRRTLRAGSRSGDGLRGAGGGAKLVRTRSVGGSVTSLLELGEVCEREREKIQVDSLVPSAPSPAAPSTAALANHFILMIFKACKKTLTLDARLPQQKTEMTSSLSQ